MAQQPAQVPGGVKPAEPHHLAALVDYGKGAVVSRTLAKGPSGTLTVFAFDEGQELSEHSAPFDAHAMVIEGGGVFIIGGKRVEAAANELVLMPANIPHAVHAPQPFKMLLIMFRDRRTMDL